MKALPNGSPNTSGWESPLEAGTNTPPDDPYNIHTGDPWLVSNGPNQVTVIECGGLLGSGCQLFGPYAELPPTEPMGVAGDTGLAPGGPAISLTSAIAPYASAVKACISTAEKAAKASHGTFSLSSAFSACVNGF